MTRANYKRKDLPAAEVKRMHKSGMTVREIASKFNCSRTPIQRILKPKKSKPGPKPLGISNKEKGRRKKIQKQAITTELIVRSEIVVNNFISVLKGIELSVLHMEEIMSEQKAKRDGIILKLQELINLIERKYKPDLDKEEVIKKIYKTLDNVGDFYSCNILIIKAAGELRAQLNFLTATEIEIMNMAQVHEFLDAIFEGMLTLDHQSYFLYRDKVIELFPPSKILFQRFEVIEPDQNKG